MKMFLKKGDKGGSAHLEMIIAFTVYITFAVFLLSYLSPVENSDLPDAISADLETSLIDYAGVEVVAFSLSPNESGCLKVDLSSYGIVGNSSVFNYSGNSFDSEIGANILDIDDTNGGDVFVYVSEEFNKGSSTCSSPAGEIAIGSIKRKTVLSNKSLTELVANYTLNYDALKSELNLPSLVEFAIDSAGYIHANQSIPPLAEVDSTVFKTEVLYANGTIQEEVFIFRVW